MLIGSLVLRHIEWTADGSGGDRDTRGVRACRASITN